MRQMLAEARYSVALPLSPAGAAIVSDGHKSSKKEAAHVSGLLELP